MFAAVLPSGFNLFEQPASSKRVSVFLFQEENKYRAFFVFT
jgi:hypothetical protein